MLAIEQCATGFATFSLVQEKDCKSCGATKLLSEFHERRDSRDGRRSICKTCQNARTAAYLKANPQDRSAKDGTLHYGVDEKFGDTWQALDAALSMCQMTTPLQKAA